MTEPTHDIQTELTDVLTEIVRSRLIRGESVAIDGLGILSVEHVPASVDLGVDVATLTPPMNVVVFRNDESEQPQ